MKQSLDEELLLEEDAAMEEASLREAGIMPVENDDEVACEGMGRHPAIDAHCMELFGLSSDCAASNGTGRQTLPLQRGAAKLSVGSDGSANQFPRLRQALEREWQRAAKREEFENAQRGKTADGGPSERHAGRVLKAQGVPAPGAPPTPSEVLAASSVRMMLGLASAFRRTNPEVLEVLCGTMLDLLLETPPLVLAPLHQIPSSIEAVTFRRVSDFCSEMIGSDREAEREAALGLYLTLAISRGQVSGVLEVVKCLLDRGGGQQVCPDTRSASIGESEPPARRPPSPGDVPPSLTAAAAAVGTAEAERRDPRVRAVLDRLAKHSVYLHLSFPDECKGMRLAAKLQGVPRPGPAESAPLAEPGIKWDCPVTAATDGTFVFAWHPSFGLVKTGTGLDGTTKGRVYAQNFEAGCGDVAAKEARRANQGFVAVIGNTVYLQTGCFIRLPRFLLARTSNLEVYGTADAVGLPFPTPIAAPSVTIENGGCRGEDGEREKGAVAREDPEPFIPLCCDGRLVYAIVPSEVSGRPSAVAVDIAGTGKATGPAVEFVPPRNIGASCAAGTDKPERNDEQGAVSRGQGPGVDGDHTGPAAPREWPWWQAGRGANRGVRSYCNGHSLVVCWVDDEGVAATEIAAASWGHRAARGRPGLGGLIPGQNSASDAEDSDIFRPTHMVRFELSTGECDQSVENNSVLSGTSTSRIPWVAYDGASNLILRCELRPIPPPTPAEHSGTSCAAEIRLCLWRNCGLTPGPALAADCFGWRWALQTLTDDREHTVEVRGSARHAVPELSKTAVFMLAHLDRLGSHYLGWSGDCTHSEKSEPFVPPPRAGQHESFAFCFDLSAPTFRNLVNLVETSTASFEAAVLRKDEVEESRAWVAEEYVGLYVLCASLRLLNVNIGILLSRGLGVVEFGGHDLRQSLLRTLLGLVRHLDGSSADSPSREESTSPRCGQVGVVAVTREALRLLVGGVDLFYPSHGLQAGVLSAYLRDYVATGESPTTASRAVMLELLQRTSSLTFLRRLLTCAGNDRGHSSPEPLMAEECLLEPGLAPSRDGVARTYETVSTLSEALLELSSAQSVRNVRQAADSDTAGGGAATPRVDGVMLSEQCTDSATQVGLAVLESLGAVLKLRCIDAIRPRSLEGVDARACFSAFVLLALQAANNVLAVAVETQRSTPATGVLERVVDALRDGLVGTLLPSCLASALTLRLDAGTDGPGTDVAGLLPQVAQKLRVLVTAGQKPRGVEETPPIGIWAKKRLEKLQVVKGAADHGQEGRISEGGEGEEIGSDTDANPLLDSLPASAWLARLGRLCAALGASMIRRLVMGPPQTPEEEVNARWLLHPLLGHAEVGSGREDADRQGKAWPVPDDAAGAVPPQSEAEMPLSGLQVPPRDCRGDGRADVSARGYTFAQHLCRHPASRESRALSTAMKRVVLEDRGGDGDINDAVWAVTIAIVHHAGVTGDAADVVRAELARASDKPKKRDGTAGAPTRISPVIIRAWRSAQTARARLTSAALSSDARALLLRRAYFLLFLKPWVSTRRGGGLSAAEHVYSAGVALALRTSEVVLECLLGPAATATRDGSNRDGDGVVKINDGMEPGVILREEDVGALLRVIEAQSRRARSRARGLTLAVSLLDGTGSDRAAADVLRAVTGGLRARWLPGLETSSSESSDGNEAAREENREEKHDVSRFHFMLGVECCDSSSKAVLLESTTRFLSQCSLVLGQGRRARGRGAAGGVGLARRSVLVHALVAAAMDYEWEDNDTLQRSELLPRIWSLVDDADRCVAAAAWTAVRAVYRCAVPEYGATNDWASRGRSTSGGGNTAGGGMSGEFGADGGDAVRLTGPQGRLPSKPASSSTPFQKAFFVAVRGKIQDMAAAAGSMKQAKLNRELPASSTIPLSVDEAPLRAGINGNDGGYTGCTLIGGEVAAAEKEVPVALTALAAAQALALAHACCRVECGRQELSCVGAVRALLRLVLLAEPETRSWALRVCAATLPWVKSSLVDGEFRSIVRERRPSFEGSFVDTCLLLVGRISGVWGRIGDAFEAVAPGHAAEPACMLDMLLLQARDRAPRAHASARVAFSLSSELVSLLHDLVVADTEPTGAGSAGGREKMGPDPLSSAWREEVAAVVRGWLLRAVPVVKSLQRQKALDEHHLWEEAARARKQSLTGDPDGAPATAARPNGHAKEGAGDTKPDGRGVGYRGQREVGCAGDGILGPAVKVVSPSRGALPPGAISADDLDRVVAVLCLLGGHFEGLHPGARVLCHLPPDESVSDPLDRWENTPAVEATVLRFGLSGAELPRIDDVEGPAKSMSSSGEPAMGSVSDSGTNSRAESPQARRQQQAQPLTLRAACPVFSASLVPRRPRCGSPLEVYQGLSDEAYAGSLAAAVVARQVVRDCARVRLMNHREVEREREHQSLSARLEHARLGSVSHEHERSNGFSLLPREPRAPVTREPVELFLPSSGGGGGGGGEGGGSASTSRQQQQRSKSQELLSLGVSREERGGAPRAVTVPVDSVALLRRKVPQALMKTLTSHVEEMLPGLKAILEAETIFRGPKYAPMRCASGRPCIVESTHPYQPGEDCVWPISVRGAETVEVSFDPMSHVAHPEDHIALSWRTPSGGTATRRISPYSHAALTAAATRKPSGSGSGGSQAWPGVGAEPPLVVAADELTARFVSVAGATGGGGGKAENEAGETATPGAWGFRLTAKGRKVPPKAPPAQPPSLERAILCDLRARSALALSALLEHREMAAGLAPLMPAFAEAMLRAASEVPIDGDGWDVSTGVDASPGGGLEQRLSRAYDLLHEQREPPTRLQEADFVQFPFNTGGSTEGASGIRSDNSSTAAHHSLATPSPEPLSSGAAGALETGDAGGLTEAPLLKETGRSMGEAWPRRYVVCIGGVWAFDKPGTSHAERTGERPAARLRHGATVTVVAQERDWLKLVYDPLVVLTPMDSNKRKNRRCHSTPPQPQPQHVWARQRQDDTFFLLPEALAAEEIDVVAGVSGGAGGGDKDVVVTVPLGEGSEEEEEEAARLRLLSAAGDGGGGGGGGGIGEWRGEISDGAAGSGAARPAAEALEREVARGDGVGGQQHGVLVPGYDGDGGAVALWVFTVDTLCTAVARSGVSAFLALASRWHGRLFSLDLCGSVGRFWEFLRLTNIVEKGDLQSAAISTLRQRVGECVASEGRGAAGRCLAGHALGTLRLLAAQPGTKAVARVFETPHPYQNRMDLEWSVYLPGAVRTKIVFDPRSRTETNCDWVDIRVIDGHVAEEGGSIPEVLRYRFHGRRGRENFPGFGGRPPLWLEGGRFVARFQSDPSATDWGVRFTAYGILGGDSQVEGGGIGGVGDLEGASSVACDNPSGEAKAAVLAPSPPAGGTVDQARKLADAAVPMSAIAAGGRAGTLEVELCCWVLEFLSRDECRVPEVASRLFDEDALRVFEECLKVFSQRRRLRVLRLVTAVIAKAAAVAVPHVSTVSKGGPPARPSSTPAARALLQVVLSQIETERTVEDESTTVQPYLQGLVECAVVLRNWLISADGRSGTLPCEATSETKPPCLAPQAPEADVELTAGAIVATGRTTALTSSKAANRRLLGGGTAAAAVRDMAAVWSTLRDFSQGTAPLRLLLKNFLPILTEACSVVVQSRHPFDLLTQRRVAVVPGAAAMRVRFDHRTEMHEDDRIVVRNPGGGRPAAGSGSPVAAAVAAAASGRGVVGPGPGRVSPSGTEAEAAVQEEGCDLLLAGEEVSILGLAGGTEEEGVSPPVSVGDLVVRGPEWAFGDEDLVRFEQQEPSPTAATTATTAAAAAAAHPALDPEGATVASCDRPGVGVVVALEKWGERDGAGARVRWTTGAGGEAAVGTPTAACARSVRGQDQERGKAFEALYSVQDPAHVRVVRRGGADRARRPVCVAGNAVEIEVGSAPGRELDTAAAAAASSESGPKHLFHFDGESTHVDLPSYRGMRLEGDFTLELWAWLDPGVARNGKSKCLLSRSLHQSFHQNRRATAGAGGRSSPSDSDRKATTAATPPVLDPISGGEAVLGGPASPRPAQAGFEPAAPEYLSWSSPRPQENKPPVPSPDTSLVAEHSTAVAPTPGGPSTVAAVGERMPPALEGVSPMEGTQLVSPTPGEDDCRDNVFPPVGEEDEGCRPNGVGWEWVGGGGGVGVGGGGGGSSGGGMGARSAQAARGRIADPSAHDGSPPMPSSVSPGVSRRGGNEEQGRQQEEEEQEEQKDEGLGDVECFLAEDDDDDDGGDHEDDDEESEEEEDDEEDEEEEEEDEEEEDSEGSIVGSGNDGRGFRAAAARGGTGDGASEGCRSTHESPPPGAVTSDNVFLGLRVKRGLHWTYRQQDGGISKVGTVVGTRRLDGSSPPDGDNPSRGGWTKVRWDNGRANSYETGANGKYSISFEDAVPGPPQDLVISSVTDCSINISWSPPARLGRPALQSYIIYRDDVEIASVGAGTLHFTNTKRMKGWPYSYSVAARGPAGTSSRCPPVAAVTATEHDRRTQLALWVGGRGEIEFAMGNERGKGVILGAGQFREGIWTHLAVSVEGRKVSVFVDGHRRATGKFVGRRLCSRSPSPAIRDLSGQRLPHDRHDQAGEEKEEEPLRLGSRGFQDHWRGRLCGVRVWGAALPAAEVRRRMSSLPAASLVRQPPPLSFGITVPATQEGFRRFRLHAPLPDQCGGMADVAADARAPGDSARGSGRKAYYEVILRSGGCMQIGWGLPASCPSSRNLGVGDDDCSWAVDGMRSMKWHGNTSPVSSPYAHGVPYGRDWKWDAGDAIGCAVDLDTGVMSFSHNGRNLGKAFRRTRGRGNGRYRVIAPHGVECRMGIDATSPVVEIYSPGTVLQVSQVESLSPSGTWRLRTAEGWVAERNVDDPDDFYTERLEQDTCDFAGHGAGAERCVFVDVLRLAAAEPGAAGALAGDAAAATISGRGGSNQGCESRRPPAISALHGVCKDIVVGERFAELARGEKPSSSCGDGVGDEVSDIFAAPAQALSTPPPRPPPEGVGVGSWQGPDAGTGVPFGLWQGPDASTGVPLLSTPRAGSDGGSPKKADDFCRAAERRRPRRTLLTRSVEVADVDAVTFFVELFVPAGPVAAAAVGGGRWAWGVVIADFDVYLTTKCRSTETERDNGGGGDCPGAESIAAEHASATKVRDDDGGAGARANHRGWGLLHIVIEGPGGFYHALPVCAVFLGRWMTLRIVAHRSGESLLVCTPGAEQGEDHERSSGDSPRPEVHEHLPELLTVEGSACQQQQMAHQQRQLRCRFSNPRFFRGNRVGCVGLYSERFDRPMANGGGGGGGGGHDSFRFLARHAVILLGSLEEQPPPALPRLRQLERLVSAEHSRRLTEPTARPLLIFARRLRQLWSGEVSLPSAPSSTALGTNNAGAPATGDTAPAAAPAAKKDWLPTARRSPTPTLTVWQALLSPGRVAFGTTVCFSRNGIRTSLRSPRASGDGGGPVQRRSLTAWEHPALQTPARFEAVPLPVEMSLKAGGGQGLWAWAPVPRSEAFVAIGLVFTGEPEPPPLQSVRCVRRELVVDAEPQKCKVVTLQRAPGGQGADRSVEGKGSGSCCRELVLVKEMGVCVPRDGAAWGLSPRVVLGDAGTGPGRRQARWDGLMPSLSGMAGQGMVVNLGHLPFRHPMEGYLPVSEVAHGDARFVLQVYDDASGMWQDVRPKHGLMDVSVPPRPPELIGSWMLCATTDASNTTTSTTGSVCRVLENDVFVAATTAVTSSSGTTAVTVAAASSASSSSSSSSLSLSPPSARDGGHAPGLVRLPPARAGGVVEVSLGGPPAPMLKGGREVWGFSLRVDPLFPSEFGGAHPWLSRRFDAFTALVWGEEGQAHVSNAELIRYVNAAASRKGVSKEALLSCDWATLQPSSTDLVDWPLVQSLAPPPAELPLGGTAGPVPLYSRATAAPAHRPAPATCAGGVEETKHSDPPDGSCSSRHDRGSTRATGGDSVWDEWIAATPDAPVGGVRVRQEPVDDGKVVWRLFPGQVARLLAPAVVQATNKTSTTDTGEVGWRSIRSPAGEQRGWLALPDVDSSVPAGPAPALERFLADRCVLEWFSLEAVGVARLEGSRSGSGVEDGARANPSSAGADFWVPLRQRGCAATPGEGPSPLSAAPLRGNSDALLLSAADADAAVGDGRPLLVTGKWKVGLITDTLTVTTRTSGCTRIVAASPVVEDGSTHAARSSPHSSSGGDGGGGKGDGADQAPEPLPVLVDGLVFGFRPVDGLLIVTRALSGPKGATTATAAAAVSSGMAHMEPVERQAVAWLGGVEEGAEVSFSVVDNGEDFMFSCQEIGLRRRHATVRAKCRDTWGRGRVALGSRSVAAEDSSSGWVRVTSQAHGATVRSGMSIDADAVVGRIPCGTVVPYDSSVVYHSPGAPDHAAIDPVVRYRCMATVTTPAGWISERGRYADHPYRICERVRARPQQPPACISHVSIARVQPSADAATGAEPPARGFDCSLDSSPLELAEEEAAAYGGSGTETAAGSGRPGWRQRLGDVAVLPVRFHLLQQLNRDVSQALRYVDLSQGDLPWSIAGALSRCRHLVFSSLKQELWQAELARTSRPLAASAAAAQAGGEGGSPPSLELRLSRGRAARHDRPGGREARPADVEGRKSLFGQAFVALRHVQPEVFRLRPGDVLYSTVFLGEHAHDAGGPYRESFAEYCAELQSGVLPLLMRCPNAVNEVGINREKWLPNPAVGKLGLNATIHGEMLEFLGRLMGVAIRSQHPLDLDLPSIVWKQLVRSPITRHDLQAIDLALTQSLSSIRDIHLRGVVTDDEFRGMGLGGFEIATANGGKVELPTPGGASREVTLDNVLEFVEMAEAFKMREYRVPVEAIRRGLASVVPIELLRLFSWDELEEFVCGRKEVDVDLLEACTEYALCSRQDAHVSAFWDVLRSFTPKEKSLFLRFAWGRSRLPLSAEQFNQPFKIQAFARAPADAYLPVAHTCFFSLELPRYSSQEVLEAKLRYAIYHCRAVDADDTTAASSAAGLGWGGDP